MNLRSRHISLVRTSGFEFNTIFRMHRAFGLAIIHQFLCMDFAFGLSCLRNLKMAVAPNFAFELTFHEKFPGETQRTFQARTSAYKRKFRLRTRTRAFILHGPFPTKAFMRDFQSTNMDYILPKC